jgi:2-aminoethylphosphonate transport system substrate-binding protein
MSVKSALLAICVAVAFGPGIAMAQSGVVTIYSADGLRDGSPNWYQTEFDAFTKATGIKVQYVEGGSAVVVDRVAKEKSNPQADVLVTLPPFIQKAAADGLLQPYTPAGADQIPEAEKDKQGRFVPLVNNYATFIYDAAALSEPPATYEDLLNPKFKNKIQYSTPGQAGDGTAVMLEVFHAFGSKDAGFAYLKKLQANNLGPSSSTGKLTALVNKGEIWVANGDLQMNSAQMAQNPNIRIFWPAGPDGTRSTIALPYYIGLVQGAPHAEAGKKLIDFLLSKEAQSQVSSIAQGFPVRQDVTPTDETYTKLRDAMKGVAVWTPDWAQVLQDLQQDVARWHRETGS